MDAAEKRSLVSALAELAVKAETEGWVVISGNQPVDALKVESYVQRPSKQMQEPGRSWKWGAEWLRTQGGLQHLWNSSEEQI